MSQVERLNSEVQVLQLENQQLRQAKLQADVLGFEELERLRVALQSKEGEVFALKAQPPILDFSRFSGENPIYPFNMSSPVASPLFDAHENEDELKRQKQENL